MTGLLVFAAIVVAVLWLVAAYNNLAAAKQRVVQAWANIDVLLRQRHDELPKLVELCEPHLKYERPAFDRVLEARAAIFGARQSQDAAALGQAESELRSAVARLVALAEREPTLAADPSFTVLRQRIATLEDGIAERRAPYNDAVEENNAAIGRFPGSLVASMGGFRPLRPLEFDTGPAAR